MEEQDVRGPAEALCAALVSGDIEAATADFSAELRQNLGEVIALLPLPVTEATIESIERGGSSAFVAILQLVGEAETVQVQTRWKDRDGRPMSSRRATSAASRRSLRPARTAATPTAAQATRPADAPFATSAFGSGSMRPPRTVAPTTIAPAIRTAFLMMY